MRKEAWTDFWKATGTESTSCIVGGNARTDNVIKSAWQSSLREIITGNACSVIEIGSGQGFLTNLVYKNFNQHLARLIAIDYAEIDRDFYEQGIELIDNLSVQDMGHIDVIADCIISNFAFEYTKPKDSIDILLKQLRSNGHIVINAHSSTTAYYKDAIDIVAAYTLWNEEAPFPIFWKKLLRTHQSNKTDFAKRYIDHLFYINDRTNEGFAKLGIITPLARCIQEHITLASDSDIANFIKSVESYIVRLNHQIEAASNFDRFMQNLSSNPSCELISSEKLYVEDNHISTMVIIKKT